MAMWSSGLSVYQYMTDTESIFYCNQSLNADKLHLKHALNSQILQNAQKKSFLQGA